MGYVESQLIAGESIVFTTKRVFSPSTAIVFGIFGVVLFLAGPIGIGIGLCVLIGVASAWMQARTTEFVVTNRRVIIKLGLLSIRTIEMNLDKIESVEVVQPWLRAHRSCGNVRLIGSGASRETFVNIMNALEFRKAIQEARERKAA